MLDDQAMPEKWMIRVEGKEYGPADLEMLQEWKGEGRVLPTNEARREDADNWTTAAGIPDLFEPTGVAGSGPPPVQVSERKTKPAVAQRSFGGILAEMVRIYARNFRQFFCLSLLIVLPSAGGQLAAGLIGGTQNVDVDLRGMVAAAFSFCMLVLTLVLWPIYIASVQVLTSEGLGGRRLGFLAAINEAVKYWPRVAVLCLFVYVIFFLLISFGFAIAVMLWAGSTSLLVIFFALGLLVVQVWMFGRFFINVLFWQQFAVLENNGVVDSLRESRILARSGRELPWFQRPLWRGAFLVSLWTIIVLTIALGSQWTTLHEYFNLIVSTPDPQVLVQKLSAMSQVRTFPISAFGLSILQKFLQPLLGIAFVILFFESRSSTEEQE